ncbi:hypothetical protein D3OALGA1CA_1439 [Olavius algarvensis associated proteobacterium Delta 3]|nr:hypothetical protein D3OALGA1CA_1439 [Olavius algarvensis associated proteobacterium Delta 3]
MSKGRYVHYGCQWVAPKEWINFDASPTLRIGRIPVLGKIVRKNERHFPSNVIYGDIVKGLPIKPNTCDGVYSSHVLEHLSLTDCRIAIKNTYRIIKNGGIFRTVLPDFEYYVNIYTNSKEKNRSLSFLKNTGLGEIRREKGVKSILINTFGNSRHRWMWDFETLTIELEKCKFKEIRRAKFGDAVDPMFSLVESKERWHNCLGIECKK